MANTLKDHAFPSGQRLLLTQGDLTKMEVDAIVNPANKELFHAGGVAALIVKAGGKIIQEESRAWVKACGAVPHDKPAYTTAGKMPCRYVIHAVGPVWGSGDEDGKLSQAVKGSLKTAEELNLKTIALPAISTGIFRFPREKAAQVIYQAVHDYFSKNPDSALTDVYITVYDQATSNGFTKVWESFHKK